jgi:prepilin signal peptidase PulO-like enzyme (type II secretory pathway)
MELILIKIFITGCFFYLGGSIASFLGVVIERTKQGEPITGRSHCACGRPLKWYENVPVIGWVAIWGTTKCCNTKLPVWYVLFELSLGLVFAAITYWILS